MTIFRDPSACGATLGGSGHGHGGWFLWFCFWLRAIIGRGSYEPQGLAQVVLNPVTEARVLPQQYAGILTALPKPLTLVGNPRAGFLEHVLRYAQVEQIAFAPDALAVDDVELCLAERRGYFVLYNFCARARADHSVSFLDRLDAPDVYSDPGVNIQRAAAGGCLGIAKHDADFFADLVDEDQAGLRFRNDRGQLAQRLRHQARLQTHLRLAHFAFEFGPLDQRSDRVHNDDIHRV